MRFTLLGLLFAMVAFGQQSPVSNPHTTAADRAAGAKIFRSHCAQCHGAKGEGGPGPNLATSVFYHGSTDADMYRNITEGIPGTAMPGTFFDGTQAWQIVAYVRSLSETASTAPPKGDAQRGEALFREKGCTNCHLVRGEGGLMGPDLSVVGSRRSAEHLREAILDPNTEVAIQYRVSKVTLNNGDSYSGFVMNEDTHSVRMLDFSKGLQSLPRSDIKQFETNKNSIMPSFKGKLSEQEVDDLVNYLWLLKRQGRPQ